ncbi:3-oxoacyl-[acyl-carrier-protein] synthase III C-terminal domain-containing protein [Bacillus sp. 1P06AnD]|uniref:3-oxoacyl-[acyl-carrier-protein] synthase III C-terminal domain-containing protein n=1 Tax=Bacillus sp. 1P06AnD TaxID=3132208 RepID=UPI0039A32830
MNHVKIRTISTYHPATKIGNEPFLEHFHSIGKDIEHFLHHMGRNERYVITDPQENSLTMGIAAAKNVLKKADLQGADIDMIIFSSQTPEFTVPTNATFIHKAIGGAHHTHVIDMNSNCGGMMAAVDHACRYMMADSRMQRALVIGSDYNRVYSNPDDEITSPNFGDLAVALILEQSDKPGYLDSHYYVNTSISDHIKFPEKGLSHMLQNNTNNNYMLWKPFDTDICLPPAYRSISDMLERNNLTKDDIAIFCLSQFSKDTILKIQENLTLSPHQIGYYGDQFGYTGTSSPFLALHEAIKEGKVQRGDYILFWTVGGGIQNVTMLFQY